MGKGRSVALFLSAAVFQVSGTTLCTLLPLKGHLSLLRHGWWSLYSVQNSNMDVWLLSVSYSGLLLLLTGFTACSARHMTRVQTSVRTIVMLLSPLCQVPCCRKSLCICH